MREKLVCAALMLVPLLILQQPAVSQDAQQNLTVIISGHAGQIPVVQMNGRSYVNIEALARLTNGSLTYKGDQITLTIPGTASTPQPVTSTSQPVTTEFSKDFMKAGIEEMSVIREWRAALVNAVQNGYPITDALVAGYFSQATTNLRLAFVAASTDSDRNAYQLLSNEFDNIQQFSNKLLTAAKNMNYISPNSVKDDPLNQKILTCARALVAMASSGRFQDDGSCH